jgi:hypothetical protein
MAADIEHWLADEPVQAYAEPLPARIGRWLRHHQPLAAGVAALLLTAVVALAISNLLVGRAQQETARALHNEEQARKERALARIDALLTADPQAVPALLAGLETTPEDVLPRLRELWAQPDRPKERTRRIRVALALLTLKADPVKDWLFDRLVEVEDPRELLLLRGRLQPYQAELRPQLWRRVTGAKKRPEERFRALAALAAYDPQSPRWPHVRREVVGKVVSVNPLLLGAWADVFRPVRGLLIEPLGEVCRNEKSSPSERDRAVDLLADYTRHRPKALVDLTVQADPRAYARLLPRVKKCGNQAITLLEQELDRTPRPDWHDPPLDAAWSKPAGKWVKEIEAAHGFLAERFALVQTLPLERLPALAEGLRPAGYRPVRVRPFRRNKEMLAATVWTRDVRPWQLAVGLTSIDFIERAGRWRKEKFIPVEAAAYEPQPGGKAVQLRYVTVWATQGTEPDNRVLFGVAGSRIGQVHDNMKQADYGLITLHVLKGSDRERYFSSVWTREQTLLWTSRWDPDEPEYQTLLTPARLQVDVGLVGATLPRARTRADHLAQLAHADQQIKAGQDLRTAHMERAFALTDLGRDREALTSWNVVLARKTIAEMYWFRALVHARLGHAKQAEKDLAEFKAGTPSLAAQETLSALVQAYLGHDAEAMKALEERLQHAGGNVEIIVTTASVYAKLADWVAGKHPERAKAYRQRAIALLKEAVRQGFVAYRRLFTDGYFDGLREHPDFRKLFERVPFDRQYAVLWHNLKDRESLESHGLDPAAHLRRCRDLARRGWRPAALAVLEATRGKPSVTASVWHSPLLTEAGRDALARRQARAAITLLHLGRPGPLWELLRHRPDPRIRTFLIHDLEPLGVAPLTLVQRLRVEPRVSARRALLLALGEYPADRLPEKELRDLVGRLVKTFQEHRDPGIHSAVDWLLRRWLRGQTLAWAQGRLPVGPVAGRDWFINRVGQTFAIVRGPKEFYMGSPATDRDAKGREVLHQVRIEHSFAIATREVTDEEFRRFFPNPAKGGRFFPEQDKAIAGGPALEISWFEAAAYCRRVSELEGVPEDQMCYPVLD